MSKLTLAKKINIGFVIFWGIIELLVAPIFKADTGSSLLDMTMHLMGMKTLGTTLGDVWINVLTPIIVILGAIFIIVCVVSSNTIKNAPDKKALEKIGIVTLILGNIPSGILILLTKDAELDV